MHFLRRSFFLLPVLLIISFLAFMLVRLAPGGPFDKERAPASPEIERNIRAKYHLDKPLLEQYRIYLNDLVQGDMGPSLKYRNHSVNDIIASALPVSMALGLVAFVLAMGMGIPAGFLMAARKGTGLDYMGSFLSLLGVCIPGFVLGPLLVLYLSIKWGIFPVAGWHSPWHVILPSFSLGVFFAGKVARIMREGMLGTLTAEYITTARAKGLTDVQILTKHAFRIAVLPVVSYSGPMLADLLTGSFVVETIFLIPGMGPFLVNSSFNRDYTMLVGIVLVYSLILLILNLLVDMAYGILDRRVKYD